MKVLQINCVYATGSTGHITQALHTRLLADGEQSQVCYGRGKHCHEDGVFKICSELYSKLQHALANTVGLKYGGCRIATQRLLNYIHDSKPDIVHLQCINGYFVNIYELISWLKQHKIKTLVTLHADFMYTANCSTSADCDRWMSGCVDCPRANQQTRLLRPDRTALSWLKMKEAFSGFDNDCTIVSVSPWLRERAERAPILKGLRHVTIENGVNTDVFTPKNADFIRNKYLKLHRKLVLHVTAFFSSDASSLKGGRYVLELAKRMPELCFAIVGNSAPMENMPDNVVDVGRVENQEELASWYSAADLCILTSLRETFSMVTAESLCCGTPVVGFLAGGPESIAIKEYSSFVEYGSIDALEAALRSMLTKEPDAMTVAAKARQHYSLENMYRSYRQEYERLLEQ